MKALLVVLGILLILVPLALGCGQPSAAPSPSTEGPGTTPASEPQEQITWRLQSFYPPPEDQLKINLAHYTELVNEYTDGQVNIELYSGGQIVGSGETLESVAMGIVDMGLTVPGYHVGFMPMAAIVEGLPMTYQSGDDIINCMWDRGMQDLVQSEYAKHGVHFLGWQDGGIMTVVSTKPLKTKEDFQGTKIRAYGQWSKFFGKLGASPVEAALTEVYQGLSMGTFDGAFTGLPGHYTLNFYEVCEYGLDPALIRGDMHDIYINLDTWNGLSSELQDAVTKASVDHATWAESYFYQNYIENYRDKLADAGIEWTEVESDTYDWMLGQAMEMWDEAAKADEASAKAMDIIKQRLKDTGYLN